MNKKDKNKKHIPYKMQFDILHITENGFYDEDYLFNNKLKSNFVSEKEINKDGYRCDNFIKNHEGLHILFSGCSVSFGYGLTLEETWTKKVFNSINNIKKCSGYFNLSIPGSSLLNQITDIFKYCRNYGNPEYILFSIPDLKRFYYYHHEKNKIGNAFYNQENDKNYRIIEVLYYQYYYMLDQYCRSNNINLISFTWSNLQIDEGVFDRVNITSFNTFYILNKEKMEKYILKYCENNKNDFFALVARDNRHFGTAYHDFWAKEIFSIIENTLV